MKRRKKQHECPRVPFPCLSLIHQRDVRTSRPNDKEIFHIIGRSHSILFLLDQTFVYPHSLCQCPVGQSQERNEADAEREVVRDNFFVCYLFVVMGCLPYKLRISVKNERLGTPRSYGHKSRCLWRCNVNSGSKAIHAYFYYQYHLSCSNDEMDRIGGLEVPG